MKNILIASLLLASALASALPPCVEYTGGPAYTMSWVAPTTRRDGTPLAAEEIDHYTLILGNLPPLTLHGLTYTLPEGTTLTAGTPILVSVTDTGTRTSYYSGCLLQGNITATAASPTQPVGLVIQ